MYSTPSTETLSDTMVMSSLPSMLESMRTNPRSLAARSSSERV